MSVHVFRKSLIGALLTLAMLISGCAIDPAFQNQRGNSPGSMQQVPPQVQVQPQGITGGQQSHTLPSAKATAVKTTAVSGASMSDASWSAAENYLESVVTCKATFSVKQFASIAGPAISGIGAAVRNSKERSTTFTPSRRLIVLGQPMSKMNFQQSSDPDSPFVILMTTAPMKNVVDSLKKKGISMTHTRGSDKGSLSHSYADGDGNGFEIRLAPNIDKTTHILCNPVYPD